MLIKKISLKSSNSDEEAELTEYDDYYEEDSLSDVDRGDHDTNSLINLNDRIRRLTSHLEYNAYTTNKYYKSTCTIDRYKLDDILENDYVNPAYTAPLSKYDNVHHRKVTSEQFAKLSQREHYKRTQYKKTSDENLHVQFLTIKIYVSECLLYNVGSIYIYITYLLRSYII